MSQEELPGYREIVKMQINGLKQLFTGEYLLGAVLAYFSFN